jgi:hypothetical protein
MVCTNGACVGCGASVSFANQVQPVFTQRCTTGCHGGPRPAEGLSLAAGSAYRALVNAPASGCTTSKVRVSPGSVANSYLINKLTGVGMCGGNMMPANGAPLTSAQLDTIRGWICQGAPNN